MQLFWFHWDNIRNLTQKIEAKNQKTGYVYGDAGRLTEIKYFNPGDHVNPVKTVTFTYDKVGKLLTVICQIKMVFWRRI